MKEKTSVRKEDTHRTWGRTVNDSKRAEKKISPVNNTNTHKYTHIYAHPHVRVMITKDAG